MITHTFCKDFAYILMIKSTDQYTYSQWLHPACCIQNFTWSDGLSCGYMVLDTIFDISLGYCSLYSCSTNDSIALHPYNAIFTRLQKIVQPIKSTPCDWACDVTLFLEEDNVACIVKPIYHESSLKFLCVPITELPISHQFRMNTESCHLIFCFKLLIFEDIKWVQMWWYIASKRP